MKDTVKTQDGIEIAVGMKVFVYPHDERHGGTIVEKEVTELHLPWYISFKQMPQDRFRFSNRWSSHGHQKLYFTREAAEAVRKKDKSEPSWMRKGHFHVACCATIKNYLADKAGIDNKQVDVKKGTRLLHVCWADKDGLHKEKMYIGNLYDLKEKDFAHIVAKMKGE